jgi:uncharacterized membrane protein
VKAFLRTYFTSWLMLFTFVAGLAIGCAVGMSVAHAVAQQAIKDDMMRTLAAKRMAR